MTKLPRRQPAGSSAGSSRLGVFMSFAAAASVLAVAAPLVGPHLAAAADWPLLRGDTQRSGVSSESDVRPPFSVLWRFTAGAQANNPCAPSIVGNLAYFAARDTTANGGVVYAVDVRTGSQKWRYPATGGLDRQTFTTAPLVQDGKVYIGASDGKMYILNANDGGFVQTYLTAGPILSSPAIYNDTLLFGSNDDTLYALNVTQPNLTSVWRQSYKTKDNVNSAPLIADGQVFLTTADQFVHAVSAATGVPKWQFRMQYNSMANGPIFADNTLYVPSGPRLYALIARSGNVRWTVPFPTDIAVPPVAEGGVVYVIDKERNLYALSSNRGRAVEGWEKPVQLPYTVIASPTIITGKNADDPGILLVPTSRNVILALSRADGKVLWEYALEPATSRLAAPPLYTAITTPLSVANGTLYALSDDGSLTAFRRDAPDSTAPEVSNVYPRPGSVISGTGTMIYAAQVKDQGSGLDTSALQMVVNGQTLDATYDRDRKLVYYRSEGKGGASAGLPNGRQNITLVAKDYQGNVREEKWSFIVDNTLPAIRDQQAPRINTPTRPTNSNAAQPGRNNNPRPNRGGAGAPRGGRRGGGAGRGRGNGL